MHSCLAGMGKHRSSYIHILLHTRALHIRTRRFHNNEEESGFIQFVEPPKKKKKTVHARLRSRLVLAAVHTWTCHSKNGPYKLYKCDDPVSVVFIHRSTSIETRWPRPMEFSSCASWVYLRIMRKYNFILTCANKFKFIRNPYSFRMVLV
jgi:hypothetical protein